MPAPGLRQGSLLATRVHQQFLQVFRSVSDQGMGCGNKSGLFAVFYHLMMANHRLLDCSHGNGSGFQRPAPLRTALAPSRKELEMSVRDNTLAGDSCRMAAPASCCKVSGVRCSPAAGRLPQPARPARSLQLGGGLEAGGLGPRPPAARSRSAPSWRARARTLRTGQLSASQGREETKARKAWRETKAQKNSQARQR